MALHRLQHAETLYASPRICIGTLVELLLLLGNHLQTGDAQRAAAVLHAQVDRTALGTRVQVRIFTGGGVADDCEVRRDGLVVVGGVQDDVREEMGRARGGALYGNDSGYLRPDTAIRSSTLLGSWSWETRYS